MFFDGYFPSKEVEIQLDNHTTDVSDRISLLQPLSVMMRM